ncbi:MAG: hypothetical protein WD118_01950, partial [Phycisphaeraceae bacterium]
PRLPMHWTTRLLAPTDISVGPCAWRITMLAGEHADYVHAHPSLIVAAPDDDDAVLAAAAPRLAALPVLLGVAEPTFARRFAGQIEQRMQALGRSRVEALVLHVDDPQELKSGGLLQTMFNLRQAGVVDQLGLASGDPLAVEWLAVNTAVRLLGVPYGMNDQAVRYRALAQATAYGMAAVALGAPPDEAATRFALAESRRVLPVLDRPLPADLEPMSDDEVAAAWDAYRTEHDEPAPLPRGRPPAGEG